MDRAQTVLILGGGVGGVVTARRLRQRLPARHRVVVVEREAEHVFAPSLLWLLNRTRRPAEISRPIERLQRHGVEVLRGNVEAIDAASRHVRVDGATLVADHLVIALGAELAPEAVPGLAGAGHNLYSLDGASAAAAALQRLERGRVVVLTAAPAYKCPAAPYEAAMLVDEVCRRRGIRDDIAIDVVAAEPAPMGVAGPEVGAGVRAMLAAKGIAYHPAHQVASVDAAGRALTCRNGTQFGYDLLLFVPPHRAPAALADSGLLGPGGWVAVDRHTLATPIAGVWALGDVVSIPLALGKPLPKAGVFAHGQAEVVAARIAAAILGRDEHAVFDGHGSCFVEVGDGMAGFGKGNFYAEPLPQVRLHPPSWLWHAGKVVFAWDWFRRWL